MFPVKWVFIGPFLVHGSAFDGTKGSDIKDVFGVKGGKDIIAIKGYVH